MNQLVHLATEWRNAYGSEEASDAYLEELLQNIISELVPLGELSSIENYSGNLNNCFNRLRVDAILSKFLRSFKYTTEDLSRC